MTPSKAKEESRLIIDTVIVWRCLWFFIIILLSILMLVIFYFDDVKRVVTFVYIVMDTSIHLYKALENQARESN
uniref:Uncharacterized protein n=1 Tax=Caenorhabditis japonica TaxID=281687 RepID=A0A8R1IDW6_CAEJA